MERKNTLSYSSVSSDIAVELEKLLHATACACVCVSLHCLKEIVTLLNLTLFVTFMRS